ncbi:MAG: HipA N-terminal domain-containing protein [Bacteroidota bacterium]
MKGNVYYNDTFSGTIEETDSGFRFMYDKQYVEVKGNPISVTLPLSIEPYESNTMFPFFDGLIPEGWLLDIAAEYWKIKPNDRMKLLLTVCEDCIGAVSVVNQDKDE